MKKIAFFTFCTLFILNAHAEKYAVHFCEASSEISAKDFSERHNMTFYSFLKTENVLLVECDTKPNLSTEVCFVSKVKTIENQFAFNTNKVLCRVNNLQNLKETVKEIPNTTLTKHAFISNQIKVKFKQIEEVDLLQKVKQLKEQFKDAIIVVNQVFTLKATTNDPLYNRQWSIENNGTNIQGNGTADADMQVDSAWDITTGNPDIKIAILDSGIDTLHEDLSANVLDGFDGFATDSTDTKGYPTPNFSSDGHGTACAGIVGALADNNKGVAGIANTSKIVPVRIFYYQDYGGGIGVQATTSTQALVDGSAFAWRVADCDIMSTSAGLSDLFIAVLDIDVSLVNAEISEAFYNGRNGFGVAMFFSSGNDDIADVLWPADLPETIAVGASSMCDERKNPSDCSTENWGSSYGKMLDIIAPGTLIASTDMTGVNGYSNSNYTNTFNGTSAACPNAAGVGALVLSVNDSLHARDIKNIMNTTATKVANYAFDTIDVHGTWNEEVGYGRVNAFDAVKLAQTFKTTVGLSSIPKTVNIKIYPNPSNGTFFVENKTGSKVKILVINAIGKLVLEREIKANATNRFFVGNGIYFVKTTLGSDYFVEKIIVQ